MNETGLDASYFEDLFNDAVDILISECIPKYRADSGDFYPIHCILSEKDCIA